MPAADAVPEPEAAPADAMIARPTPDDVPDPDAEPVAALIDAPPLLRSLRRPLSPFRSPRLPHWRRPCQRRWRCRSSSQWTIPRQLQSQSQTRNLSQPP